MKKTLKLDYFIEQPSVELHKGIKVYKDTKLSYSNESVEQELKELTLETILIDSGTNGINSYSSKTYLKINLNEGDILAFDKDRGFYLPTYPLETIEDAVNDIEPFKDIANKGVEIEL